VANSISSLDGLIAKLKAVLSNKSIHVLEINVTKMQTAEKKAAYSEIALLAVDSYKILADELDQTTLKVPKQVVILDYVGFRIHALLRQNEIDWHLISETVDEGKSQWEQVKRKVTNKGLYDSLNTTITGLEIASTSKNIDMLKFAAQVDLDLVDLLEGFFEKKSG
jgi:galactitol-specific phosphotransferase system IIB component